MKKLVLLSLATLLLVSCYTPTVNQTELYGTVEDIVYYNGHNHVKVWCKTKDKYYNVITDKLYQKGETIRIK
jgi:uncharacterized protein YcfL